MISTICLLICIAKLFLTRRSEHLSLTKINYCSEYFIIVDKQADFKINSNRKCEQTVQTFLRQAFPDVANEKLFHEFYFPHRLDYATSGILCIPKNKEVCKTVSEAFSNRSTKKYYIALVRGFVSKHLVDINIPVGDDIREIEIQKMCTMHEPAFCQKARVAQTVITVLEEGIFNNYPATKVLCQPVTGRRHQIRVHCSFLGHTIVGDYTYSNRKDVEPSRMYLHSLRLVLPNKIEDVDVSTSDPFLNLKDWKRVKVIQNISSAYRKIDDYVKSLHSL